MRLSRLFKLSFVGTLIFTPAMAQNANEVHDEALKVLRSQPGKPASPASTGTSVGSRTGETREERQNRLKAEARRQLAERERLQAEKDRQFQEYVKERERLRQQQQEQDELIARQPGTAQPAATDVHNQALEVLRQSPNNASAATMVVPPAAIQPATSSPFAAQPSTEEVQQRALEILREQRAQPVASPVTEAELAPRVVAQPMLQNNSADTHQQALEVLRQQMQSAPAPRIVPVAPVAPAAPAATPRIAPPRDDLKPSPDLQRRLEQIQRELNTPEPRSSRSSAESQAYLKELEERALQDLKQSAPAPAATAMRSTPAAAAPALDAQTREMISRQNEQIRQSSASSLPRTAALDPAAEARARNLLRQQQQAVSQPRTVANTQARIVSQAPPVQTTASPIRDVNYSRELEERARQALLERAGTQPPSAAAPAALPTAQPVETISSAPLRPNAELEQVHSRAMETLVQVKPADDGQTQLKSKRDRIRAITELYIADKMTPAEYHKRRAEILAEPAR